MNLRFEFWLLKFKAFMYDHPVKNEIRSWNFEQLRSIKVLNLDNQKVKKIMVNTVNTEYFCQKDLQNWPDNVS